MTPATPLNGGQEASSLRPGSGRACPTGNSRSDSRPQLVVVSALPWAGIPHRQHELAAGLAEQFDCIYFEPPKGPGLMPRGRVLEPPTHPSRPEFGGDGPAAFPRVAQTFTPVPKLLWYLSRRAESLRFRLAWQAIASQQAGSLRYGPGRARLLWVDGGSSAPAVTAVPYDLLVYDCVDLDWAFSRIPRRRAALRAWHRLLLARADVVLFSMRALYLEQVTRRGGCHFVPNACSSYHFAERLPCPLPLGPMPRPRLGFVGAMLADRFDSQLIATIARHHPEWQLALAGEADRKVRARLEGCPNVHLLGRQPHPQMPAYLTNFDVCLLPNRVDTELSYCFPKKLYEYLAAGRPVVSTAIPEALPLEGTIKIGHTPEEFAQQVQAALDEEADPSRAAWLHAERQALARENTWQKRVEQVAEILYAELRRRGLFPERECDAGPSHHCGQP